MIIVLCGKSNAGKGYVSNLFEKLDENTIHLDIDKIAHKINEEDIVKKDLVNTFGENILTNGKIDRKKLGSIVFNDEEEMKKLEEITWKHMEEEIDNYILNNSDKNIILDYIMLHKTKYFNKDNLKILVDAPLSVRLKRALIRDGITKDKFLERESKTANYKDSDFDYVINNEDENKTRKKVLMIYEKSTLSR